MPNDAREEDVRSTHRGVTYKRLILWFDLEGGMCGRNQGVMSSVHERGANVLGSLKHNQKRAFRD